MQRDHSIGQLIFDKRTFPGQVVEFSVRGQLTIKTGMDFTNRVLREIIERKMIKVNLDLVGVEYIDSFGIGRLLKINNEMRAREEPGEVEYKVNAKVRQRLGAVGADRMLNLSGV